MPDTDFWTLIAQAIGEMEAPKKTKSAYKYTYAPLEEVLRVVLPPLRKRGIELMQYVDGPWTLIRDGHAYEDEAGSNIPRQCEMVTCAIYQGKRYTLDRHPFWFASEAQDMGARETYARRYSLQTVFNLAAMDDTDGIISDPKSDLKAKYNEARNAGVSEKAMKEALEQAVPNKSTDRYTDKEAVLAVSIIDGMIGG